MKPNTAGLRKGNPGNKGGGNTSTAYRIWLASLLESPKHQKAFIQTIQDPDAPHFLAATKHAAAYAHGMPIQSVEVKDTTPDKEMTGEDIRRRLLGAVPALIHTLPGNAQERAQLLADLKGVEATMDDE